jgi:hypothetical protein
MFKDDGVSRVSVQKKNQLYLLNTYLIPENHYVFHWLKKRPLEFFYAVQNTF